MDSADDEFYLRHLLLFGAIHRCIAHIRLHIGEVIVVKRAYTGGACEAERSDLLQMTRLVEALGLSIAPR